MSTFGFRPPLFFLTGLAWLILSSLLGLGLLFGLVLSSPLPSPFRLIHVHAALVGGVAQMILGAITTFVPPLLMSGRDQSTSHPIVYTTINLGTVILLAGFALEHRVVVAAGGLLVMFAFLWLVGETLKQVRSSLVSPPLNLWFYGAAVLILLVGLAIGEAMTLRLFDSSLLGQARLAHIHLNVLGFVTLTIMGTMHNLFPTVLNGRLHSPLAARLTFFLMPAGVLVLFLGFMMANVWVQIAAGGVLIVGVLLYAYNIARTWLSAGQPSSIAADHLMAGTAFLVLAVVAGVLVSVNYLWDPPKVPFGSLHLMAYTHLAFIGFILQTIFGALSHLLPIGLALQRVQSNKKRGPYLEVLTAIIDRWRAAQVITLTMGTLGLAVIASLVWQFPLNSPGVKVATWASILLLLASFAIFAVKVGLLLGRQPHEEAS